MEDAIKEMMKDAIKVLPEYTPDYVIDEVQYYFNKTGQGKPDCFTLDNAMLLVNMARVNNRIDDEQAKNIKDAIRKIKNEEK